MPSCFGGLVLQFDKVLEELRSCWVKRLGFGSPPMMKSLVGSVVKSCCNSRAALDIVNLTICFSIPKSKSLRYTDTK